MKIAFIVGTFPKISEPFIIDQACDLMDRGIEVDIYAFRRFSGDNHAISDRYRRAGLDTRTRIIGRRAFNGRILFRALWAVLRFRSLAYLKPIFWDLAPFSGQHYDLYHCHFGSVAKNFILIREVLDMHTPFVTTLYGQDVGERIVKVHPNVFRRMTDESRRFLVMSENMKQRAAKLGFPEGKLVVHPVGVPVANYPHHPRQVAPGEPFQLISVGRFVEKKGFDDLLRALALVKEKASRAFRCTIIGDGPLRANLYALAERLNLGDVVSWKGMMNIKDIIAIFGHMHVFIQPSKTATDGDME